MQEAVPVFLTLALLLVSMVATGLAVHGAWLFAGASRLLTLLADVLREEA